MLEQRVDESAPSFVQIFDAQTLSNDETELIPVPLYVDDSMENLSAAISSASATSEEEMLLANRYEMQRVLGQGGFGRTYLTLDRHRFHEPCVVKEFLPQQQGEYETQKSRELFVREAKILHQIDHPQIPKFFACFEEDKKLFLVQEYVKGQTYATLLQERRQAGRTFSEPEIIQWLQHLLPVLRYLHDQQIVHRDISLDNIMLQDESHLPMLIDFGIGRSVLVQGHQQGENGVVYPMPQSIVGKIGYSPYEQIWLGQSFPSSDLYALAVTAVVLLTGINPQTLTSQLSLREEWQLQTFVSKGLVTILNRMLQDIPDNRYQSAAAILADLEQLTVAGADIYLSPADSAFLTTMVSVPPTATHPQLPSSSLTPELLRQYEQELVKYVGPIGKFLVQNTLAKDPHLSAADLIMLLAQHIPQPVHANEFRNHLRCDV
jgi:serine/threonine protein kinase